jgi:hypothetical protein
LFNFFNSLKEIEIGDVYEFSFGNYYKTLEGNSTPIEGTFEGINYKQMNFNEINKLNAIGNEISFYFREDTGDILFIIALSSYLENGVRKYSNIRRFYAPDYPSDGDLNYEHSSYCEQWDAAENFTNDLPKKLYTYIPDDNFEQALIDLGYDDELDDYVLTDNIVDIEEINYLHGGIESLEGIQNFTNLKRLILFNYPDFVTVNYADLQQRIDDGLKNNIQFADLTNNKKLVYVSLSRNIALESINIDGLTELIGLVLNGCQNLSSIDLSTNTKLEWLNLGFNNKITEIDLTNLLELGRLHLRAKGNLNSLDISNNSKIVDLDTQYTNLECIKVSDYQIQNQINSNSIDGESSFTVWFSDISGQTFDVNWEKDSDTTYSLDCN